MNERPKSVREFANEMLLKSNPREMLEEEEKKNPSLASLLKGKDIDVTTQPK